MLKLMQGIVNSSIRPATTIWGKDLFAKLWSKWPKFTIFPSPFFNTEWLISKTDVRLSELIEESWFKNNGYAKDNLFLEAFAWHWHNSSNKHKNIESGSKFDILKDLTNEKLKERFI